MAHPYMANSTPQARQEMLEAIGVHDVDELFRQIPNHHRIVSPLRLPSALSSEVALERHLRELLSKNTSCEQVLNFLGAGCWQHYVPAACDEIVRRREWLTSVFGSPMSDHGRNQAWFEFCSQLAELIGMEFVGCQCIAGVAPLGMPFAWRPASPRAARCWWWRRSTPSASR
jgi:glycine dehydrogenase subunit 1